MNDADLIGLFSSTRILFVGDVMLDQFVRGTVSRISPEAPIPILHIKEQYTTLGGAGNVVRNLEALGSYTTFISVVGKDRNGSHIRDLLKIIPRVDSYLIVDDHRTTTTKTRFIAGNQQILRTDLEQQTPVTPAIENELLDLFKHHIDTHDLVILSDYAKGVFSSQLLQSLIQEAKGKPVLVDPKG